MLEQTIDDFRQRIAHNYMKTLSLPSTYCFLDGTPVQALPPCQTTRNSVMIVGAYPAARYDTIGDERFVPVGNITQPFDPAAWAGDELDKVYLHPLGLQRQQCWITNLVRCYLFEERGAGQKRDITKYRNLGVNWPEYAVRDRFDEYARQGMAWLDEELQLAQPRLVITLGSEVAAAFHPDLPRSRRTALVENIKFRRIKVNEHEWTMVHLAHPGSMVRGGKWRALIPAQIEYLKPEIQKRMAEG
jgi:uracil-DNA glycosylase